MSDLLCLRQIFAHRFVGNGFDGSSAEKVAEGSQRRQLIVDHREQHEDRRNLHHLCSLPKLAVGSDMV